ncbi:MAG: ArsR family transcriptional regulator [Spartobacteria bacterium]
MKTHRYTRRLLQSTRGQIILLLREKSRTVAELAEAISLTDNAVRAHLATLERDGLVRQGGERAGFRKPHFSYELTAEADELFPKAYAPVLNDLLAVLKDDLGNRKIKAVLQRVGRQFAGANSPPDDLPLKARLEGALKIIENLGGQARVTRENGKTLIRGAGCPLAAVTAHHVEVCGMLETLLTQIIGHPVRQACERESSPQCCFEVETTARAKKTGL